MVLRAIIALIIFVALFCFVRCIAQPDKCCCIFCSADEDKARQKRRGIATFIALTAILTAAFFLMREILFFNLLLIVSILINYYQVRLRLPFDVSPSLVFTIIVSMRLGFVYGLVFLFLGSVAPGIAVSGFNHITFIFVCLAAGISYISSLNLIGSMLVYGILMICIQSVFSFMIAKAFSADPNIMASVFIGFGLNIFYFTIFSDVLFKALV
jgi:hypothetical protein